MPMGGSGRFLSLSLLTTASLERRESIELQSLELHSLELYSSSEHQCSSGEHLNSSIKHNCSSNEHHTVVLVINKIVLVTGRGKGRRGEREEVALTLLMVLPLSEVLMVMLYLWSFFRPWGKIGDMSPS